MGEVPVSALVLVGVAPILGALASWAAERTIAALLETPARPDRPAGFKLQIALAIVLALGTAWLSVAAWGAGPRGWTGFLLAQAFIYSALVDARTRYLPHWPTMIAGIVGLALAGLSGGLGGVATAAAAALAAGAALWLVSALFRMIARREGIGLGDIFLVAAGGALLGPVNIWTALAAGAAGTAGLVVILRRMGRAVATEIPFGPGLLSAIWIGWAASAMGF